MCHPNGANFPISRSLTCSETYLNIRTIFLFVQVTITISVTSLTNTEPKHPNQMNRSPVVR